MKKLIALILILAMLLPAASVAEDRDPIVRCWYMLYDAEITPEMAANFPGYDKMISIYDFLENGTITLYEFDIRDGQATPISAAAGKWSKTNGAYSYSIIGLGEGDAYVKDGDLFLGIPSAIASANIHMRLRGLEYYDPYSDYVYR